MSRPAEISLNGLEQNKKTLKLPMNELPIPMGYPFTGHLALNPSLVMISAIWEVDVRNKKLQLSIWNRDSTSGEGPCSLQVLKAIRHSRVHKKTSLCIGLLWKSLPSRWRARVIAAFWSRHEVRWPKWRNHGKARVCGFVLHLRPHLSVLLSSNDGPFFQYFVWSQAELSAAPAKEWTYWTG